MWLIRVEGNSTCFFPDDGEQEEGGGNYFLPLLYTLRSNVTKKRVGFLRFSFGLITLLSLPDLVSVVSLLIV